MNDICLFSLSVDLFPRHLDCIVTQSVLDGRLDYHTNTH